MFFSADTPVEGELPVKRSLSHRLGGRADGSEDPDQPSQRGECLNGQLGLGDIFVICS